MTDSPTPAGDQIYEAQPQSPCLHLPAWIHAFAFGGVFLLILLLWGASTAFQGQNIWNGWKASSELQSPIYAEAIHVRELFRTQANTWSNLIYVLTGLYAIGLGLHDQRSQSTGGKNYLTQTPAMSLLFGASCVCLGVGSGVFHASLSRWGQHLDVTSMYAPLLVLIAIHLGRWWPVIPYRPPRIKLGSWPFLIGFVCIASACLYHFKWSMSSRHVLSTLILLVLLSGIIDRFTKTRTWNTGWLITAIFSLIVGVTCRQLDVAGRFSGPDAWYQGHAFWHVLTGLSLGCQYFYQRSERTLAPQVGISAFCDRT